MADLELRRGHGFYKLSALTEAGQSFLADQGGSCLLSEFFGDAGLWCADHVLPAGLSVIWNGVEYRGTDGIAALEDYCQ